MTEPVSSTRRIPFWLTLSLMGNMLLLGLLAGMLLKSGDRGREPFARPMMQRTLAPDDRQALRDMMRDSYRATLDQREERRAIRQELSEALLREPFDEEAVRASFRRLREADETVHAKTHEAMIRRLQALPPEQRERMGELLARRPDGRHDPHRFGRHEEPRD